MVQTQKPASLTTIGLDMYRSGRRIDRDEAKKLVEIAQKDGVTAEERTELRALLVHRKDLFDTSFSPRARKIVEAVGYGDSAVGDLAGAIDPFNEAPGLAALDEKIASNASRRREQVASGALRADAAFDQLTREQNEIGARTQKLGGAGGRVATRRRFAAEAQRLAEASSEWKKLSPGAQRDLRSLFTKLEEQRFDSGDAFATRKATRNVLEQLENGTFATAKGEAAMRTLGAAARKSPAHLSDAVLRLSSADGVNALLETGKISPRSYRADDLLPVCEQVSRDVALSLKANNKGGKEHHGLIDAYNGNWGALSLRGSPVVEMREQAAAAGVVEIDAAATPEARLSQVAHARRRSEIALRAGAGNCGEHAVSVATRLHELGMPGVEIMMRSAPDGSTHAFVAVGRDPSSNPNDPNTWGEGAIVVDAWNWGKAYPAYGRPIAGHGPIESKVRFPDPID